MFRSRIARMMVMAILLGSLSSTPASAYMERPNWLERGNPDDPVSVGISTSVSSTAFPITANLAGPNLIPGVSGIAPKVAIVSTGIDKNVFPATVAARIEVVGPKDVIGYGTYAASAVLQASPDASIYSYNIYPAEVPSPSLLNTYLKQIKDSLLVDATRLDAVLIAIPPSDVLDPISGAMDRKGWDFLLQAAAQSQFQTEEGAMVGIPSDAELLSSRNLPQSLWASTEAFRRVSVNWESIRTTLKTLKTKVATVIPAGDFGSGVQRILGLANLPELITVGGYNPQGMISTSTVSGPSIDLKIKPDLLATTGIVGIAPTDTAFADYIADNGVEQKDATITYESVADPILLEANRVKSRLDTTLTSAAFVAARLAVLKKNGVADPATQLAALYTKTVPLASVPAYKQGRGVLGGPSQALDIPTSLSSSMTLISSVADLGLEPGGGSWNSALKVIQGSVSVVTPTVGHYLGVDVLGRTTATVTSTAYAPALSSTSSSSTVTVTATPDDEEPGFYSGYLSVVSNAAGVTSTTDIPMSLVKGFRPVVHSLYIHELSVTDTAFSLAPALPPGTQFMERALAKIPLSPFDPTLDFTGTGAAECLRYYVTGTVMETCQGLGRFDPIPPGFYWARMWSDYSTPLTYDVTVTATSGTASPQTRSPNIGGNISYTQFKTLLLPAARDPDENYTVECVESYGPHDDWSGHNPGEQAAPDPFPKPWQDCTEQALDDAVKKLSPDTDLRYEGPNGAFLLDGEVQGMEVQDPAQNWGKGDAFRINMGYIRKAAATNISSRYIDIIASPCDELDFLSFSSPNVATYESLINAVTSGNLGWSGECHGFETLLARRGSGGSSAGSVAVSRASYPFSLTTPNAFTNFNLNFSYELVNAAIVATVRIGGEVGTAIITPQGVVQLPPKSIYDEIDLAEIPARGTGSGDVNLEFNLLSENHPTGTVTFLFTPFTSYEIPGTQLLPIWAAIKDSPENNETLSFKVETNTPAEWPAKVFPGKGENLVPWERCGSVNFPTATHTDCGHTFKFDSNLDPWRMVTPTSGAPKPEGQVRPGECRAISKFSPSETAHVCEQYSVFTHLPNVPTVGEYGFGVDETWASLMDVLDASGSTVTAHTSVMQELKDSGGGIYVPGASTSTMVTHSSGVALIFSGTPETALLAMETIGAVVTTTSRYFEQLEFPMQFLLDYPNKIEVCLNDGDTRWQSGVTATIESICTGQFDSQGKWVETKQQVPCIPRYPAHPTPSQAADKCKAHPSSGQRTPVGPYVPYNTTWSLLD